MYEIRRQSEATAEVIVFIPELWTFCIAPDGSASDCTYPTGQCATGSRADHFAHPYNLMVDAINGNIYVAVRSYLGGTPGGYSIVQISGLPSLLDIVPTFQPAAGTLSWVTPKHPEALPAADRFQVYVGDLRDLPNFGRAVPVACAVPDPGPPQPGDFLSILDPLPNPPAGKGRYVIIGVEHAGLRRFGRQFINGILSGRDPSAFAVCN
jgi:hypothetical protein